MINAQGQAMKHSFKKNSRMDWGNVNAMTQKEIEDIIAQYPLRDVREIVLAVAVRVHDTALEKAAEIVIVHTISRMTLLMVMDIH